MHKEKVRYYDPKKKKYRTCTAKTFDTKVHVNRGKKHAMKDIERLLREEQKEKRKSK